MVEAFEKQTAASRRVFVEGRCDRFLYREGPDDEGDSGWRVFAGGEGRADCDDAANSRT